MSQFFKQLLPAVLVVSLIVACQKQQEVGKKPSQPNLLTLARTDSKDYRIPKDTAAAWTSRWQYKNAKEFGNKIPLAFTLPINGLEQLQAAAATHGTQLSGVRVYLSVNEAGEITALYTPVGIDKQDILYYNNDGENNFTTPRQLETYDGTEACGGGGCATMGILNSPR